MYVRIIVLCVFHHLHFQTVLYIMFSLLTFSLVYVRWFKRCSLCILYLLHELLFTVLSFTEFIRSI